MSDELKNQRPANEQGRTENRGLTRNEGQEGYRSLSGYRGDMSPFELMRRFTEDVDRMFGSIGFGNYGNVSGQSLLSPSETRRQQVTGASTGRRTASWAPSVDIY